jgi:hypothetical protein
MLLGGLVVLENLGRQSEHSIETSSPDLP